MKTTEDWLKEKVWEYERDPKEALENMLATTNVELWITIDK